MNVDIKLNGTSVKEYVVSYNREKKICTGVGTFDVVFEESIPNSMTTWDTIDLYEDSIHVGEYYISTITTAHADSTKTVHCQDESKKLVDYFIVDTYTIEEESYSRYWIEKFLNESGVNYSFNTAGQGNLLGNYTQLGLTSVFDQLQTLLQMNGWYMHFSASNVLQIGTLGKGGPVDHFLNRTDILSITKVSDDKMLRNRAVILGGYNSIEDRQISVDKSVNTRWNYDSRDKRAVVISNSSIPDTSNAAALASTVLKEFARITEVKEVHVHGTRDINLGDIVWVESDVFTGKGQVTSIGAEMSKDGFITTVVLDERCPRLFGFYFNADYVYIGTDGEGVWRKHLYFADQEWENFSDGIEVEDLFITDLHVSNDRLICVTSTGKTYTRFSYTDSWSKVTFSDFISPTSNTDPTPIVTSSENLYTRSCILDRETNNAYVVVDTYSGINFPSYKETLYDGTGGMISYSGIQRTWVAGIGANNSALEGIPLHTSGNYDILGYDVETDLSNVYASVVGVAGLDSGFTNSSLSSVDERIQSYMPISGMYNNSFLGYHGTRIIGVFDNQLVNESDVVTVNHLSTVGNYGTSEWSQSDVNIRRYYIDPDAIGEVSYWDATIPAPFPNGYYGVASTKESTDTFTIYAINIDYTAETVSLGKIVINVFSGVTSFYLINTFSISGPSGAITYDVLVGWRVIDGKIGISAKYTKITTSETYLAENVALRFFVYNIETGNLNSYFTYNTTIPNVSGYQYGRKINAINGGKDHETLFHYPENSSILQNGDSLVLAEPMMEYYIEPIDSSNYKATVKYGVLMAGAGSDLEYVVDGDLPFEVNLYTSDTFMYNYMNSTTASYNFNRTSCGVSYRSAYGLDVIGEGSIEGEHPFFNYNVSTGDSYFELVYGGGSAQGIVNLENSTGVYKAAESGGGYRTVDPHTLHTVGSPVTTIGGYTLYTFHGTENSTEGGTYFSEVQGSKRVSIDLESDTITSVYEYFLPPTLATWSRGALKGNFLFYFQNYTWVDPDTLTPYQLIYTYCLFTASAPLGTSYSVLKINKEDSEVSTLFNTTVLPRIEISNITPIYTVSNIESSQRAYYGQGHSEEYNYPIGGVGFVNDLKYYRPEYTEGTLTGSGNPYIDIGLYSTDSGLNSVDLATFDSISGIIITNSGMPNMVETTNYYFPDQFIFVSMTGVDGVSGTFLQKDVNSSIFTSRTINLPSPKITIIRVDDKY